MPAPFEDLLRELAPQVLGVLVRRFGDFDAAEDATQEALLAAATHWERIPDNPRGWLIQTGSRKLLDQVRADQARRRRERLAFVAPQPEVYDRDDTLTVLFLCCHPDLTAASAIALTLRAAGGLTTAEIAAAFLVPEATMAQRISRAKQRIRTSNVRLRMPDRTEWPARLRSVLRVLYLIFNEGYTSSTGDTVHRTDLSAEAIRLTRMLQALLLPDDASTGASTGASTDASTDASLGGEVAGLLALMLLTDARRPARVDAAGDLVPLAEQDRSRWLRPLIVEGTAVLDAAFRAGAVGEFQLQAAIAALHDRAARAQDTDWPQILALYGLLDRMTGNPVVALNRAVAAAMVHGPAEGLRLLAALDARLPGSHRLDAVRGHLHELAGDTAAAVRHYRAAAARTASTPERRYLTTRAARLHHMPYGGSMASDVHQTVPTGADVGAFVEAVADERRRADARLLVEQMTDVTGQPAVLWGRAIGGFGSRHYRYDSGREGDMPAVSFSPRKAQTVLYLTGALDRYQDLLDRLGAHTLGKGCLYLKRVDTVDAAVLREIIARSFQLTL